jgi:esterase
MKLFYRQQGDTGTPVIILHGLFGTSDNWLSIGKVLAQRYRVFMIDQRNHGQSPHDNIFSYDSMAADLMEFITDHQIDSPVLIGHSMGGKTIMQFAMDYPTAFSKLIVVDIAPKYYPVHHHIILQGLFAIPLGQIKSRQEANEILARFEENEGVRQFLLKNLYRNTATGQFSWRINLPVIADNIHVVGEDLHKVHEIEQPTLFISGGNSNYIMPEDHRLIAETFPNVEFISIPNAGHWVQADQPRAFVDTVIDFVG